MKLKFPTWPSFSKEEAKLVQKIILSGKVNYWTGDEGKLFEAEFSKWSGAKYSVATANGTVALEMALKALQLSPGEEVIVTPRSFIASVSSVVNLGLIPVFADVDINSGNIDAETISKVVTKKTKAIICVHLAGWPCEMDQIMELARKKGLYVIEDCAQAHGSSYKGRSVGTIGHIGTWSFCQDKIMTTGGEGGMVTTNSKSFWKRMWSIKDHGKDLDLAFSKKRNQGFVWLHNSFGSNYRMTEMQSSLGRVQLRKLEKWNRIRKRNSEFLNNCFKEHQNIIRVPKIPKYSHHAFYKLYVYLKKEGLKNGWNRRRIVEEINLKGVPCFTGSCPEIYLEGAFRETPFVPKKRLPVAKLLGEVSLVFLVHPSLTFKDMKKMAEAIQEVFSKASKE